MEHDGCEGCRYEDRKASDNPCNACKASYMDLYKPKPRQSNVERIRSMEDIELAEFLCKVEQNVFSFTRAANPVKKTMIWLHKEVKE